MNEHAVGEQAEKSGDNHDVAHFESEPHYSPPAKHNAENARIESKVSELENDLENLRFRQATLSSTDEVLDQELERTQNLLDEELRKLEVFSCWHGFQNKYLILEKVASGRDGTIVLVAPRKEAMLMQERFETTPNATSINVDADTDFLVFKAAKISHQPSTVWAREEMQVLEQRLPNHVSLLPLLDRDQSSACGWYAFKYLLGPTLEDAIPPTDDEIPSGLFWHIFVEVYEGLQAVHTADLMHGDVHAANVMFDPSETSYHDYPRLRLIDYSGVSFENQDRKMSTRGKNIVTFTDLTLQRHMAKDKSDLADVLHSICHGQTGSRRNPTTGRCGCELTARERGIRVCGSGPTHDFLLEALQKMNFENTHAEGFTEILERAKTYRQSQRQALPPAWRKQLHMDDLQSWVNEKRAVLLCGKPELDLRTIMKWRLQW
ncbi:MAG: hypothetical protein M1828_000709 [Chrysothrix sp. TS-e1954]|nr:MAG: hypothetical protein M1828_000709 [Chrysothrix sp. TS-e1954]